MAHTHVQSPLFRSMTMNEQNTHKSLVETAKELLAKANALKTTIMAEPEIKAAPVKPKAAPVKPKAVQDKPKAAPVKPTIKSVTDNFLMGLITPLEFTQQIAALNEPTASVKPKAAPVEPSVVKYAAIKVTPKMYFVHGSKIDAIIAKRQAVNENWIFISKNRTVNGVKVAGYYVAEHHVVELNKLAKKA